MPDEKTADARAILMENVYNVPEARPYLEEAIARAYPKAPADALPGRHARLIQAQTLAEVDKRIAEDKKQRDEERRLTALEREHQQLREQGFTDTDITAIEKLMVDEAIGTHANAAHIYRARSTVATPRAISSRIEMPGRSTTWASYFTGIKDDPDKWGREKVDQIMTDFANGRGARWLDENYWPAHPTAAKVA